MSRFVFIFHLELSNTKYQICAMYFIIINVVGRKINMFTHIFLKLYAFVARDPNYCALKEEIKNCTNDFFCIEYFEFNLVSSDDIVHIHTNKIK